MKYRTALKISLIGREGLCKANFTRDALVRALSFSGCCPPVLGERTGRAAERVEFGRLGYSPDPPAADVLEYQLSSLFKMALCSTNLPVLCNLKIKTKGKTWLYFFKLCNTKIFTSQNEHTELCNGIMGVPVSTIQL